MTLAAGADDGSASLHAARTIRSENPQLLLMRCHRAADRRSPSISVSWPLSSGALRLVLAHPYRPLRTKVQEQEASGHRQEKWYPGRQDPGQELADEEQEPGRLRQALDSKNRDPHHQSDRQAGVPSVAAPDIDGQFGSRPESPSGPLDSRVSRVDVSTALHASDAGAVRGETWRSSRPTTHPERISR